MESDPDLPYGPLLKYVIYPLVYDCSDIVTRTLEALDEFVQLKAAQILTVLISSETIPIQHQLLNPFIETLAACVQGASPNKRDVGVQCLEALLARPECRKAVWGITGIIAGSVTLRALL